MKTNRLKQMGFALALLSILACENEQEAAITQAEKPFEGAPVNDTQANQPVQLATISAQGHQVEFYGVGDEDVLVIESVPVNEAGVASNSIIDQSQAINTPFALFDHITSADVSVPAMIANTAQPNALTISGRSVDQLNTPISVVGELSPVITEACTDVGSSNFRTTYCGGSFVSEPKDIRYCTEGIRTFLSHTTYFGTDWKKLSDTRTKTNTICGKTNMKFYEWKNSAWELATRFELEDGVITAWLYTVKRRYRKVERERLSGDGFRSFTRFYNK